MCRSIVVCSATCSRRSADDRGSACLFESVIGGEKVGRYSFLAAEPFKLFEAFGRNISTTSGRKSAKLSAQFDTADQDPLSLLRDFVKRFRVAHLSELPPFVGGAVGYAGYDTVRYVEDLPNAPSDDRGLPDLSFAFYDHMVVFDNVQKTVIVVVLGKVREPFRAEAKAVVDLGPSADLRTKLEAVKEARDMTPSASASSTSVLATYFRW
jgi:anthranilate synthase component 1